jgi:hypothetical protein
MFRDISELRITEEAEEQVHQALESRVKERTRELEKLNAAGAPFVPTGHRTADVRGEPDTPPDIL